MPSSCDPDFRDFHHDLQIGGDANNKFDTEIQVEAPGDGALALEIAIALRIQNEIRRLNCGITVVAAGLLSTEILAATVLFPGPQPEGCQTPKGAETNG